MPLHSFSWRRPTGLTAPSVATAGLLVATGLLALSTPAQADPKQPAVPASPSGTTRSPW